MDLTEMGYEYVDWIYIAQVRFQWWSLVVIVINSEFHMSSLLNDCMTASPERFFSIELV
jgi:hypothetical protein